MISKENYCYWILKKYSLIVDFSGASRNRTVPDPIEGETYRQWKDRVLGDGVSDVILYTPDNPRGNTKISTLQTKAGAEHLEEIFKAFGDAKKKEKDSAVDKAEENIRRRFSSFPKDALEDLIFESGDSLEPSVKDFLDRFVKNVESTVDVEMLFKSLLFTYNDAVRQFRGSKGDL